MGNHGVRDLWTDMREFGKLMVLMLGLVWAPLGLCWAAPRVGLGIHWATWGCHGPFLDTLMTHTGEHRQPKLEMREKSCTYHGFRALRKEVREAWRLILGPVWGHVGSSRAAPGVDLGIH